MQIGINSRSSLVFCLVVGLLSSALSAQAPKVRAPKASDGALKWKFRKGQQLEMITDQTTEMKMAVQGQNIKTSTKALNTVLVAIKDVDDDGVASATNTITRMTITTKSPGISIKYDSDDKKEPTGMSAQIAKTMKPMIGVEVTQKWAPTGKVFDVNVPESALKGFQGGPAAAMMNKGTFEEMSKKASLVFPKEKMTVGESWEESSKMQMGPAAVKIDTAYKYLGVADGNSPLHVFQADVKMSFPDGINGADVDITKQECKSYVYFDGNLGRLVKSEVEQDITMKISGLGQAISQELTQKIKIKLSEKKGN